LPIAKKQNYYSSVRGGHHVFQGNEADLSKFYCGQKLKISCECTCTVAYPADKEFCNGDGLRRDGRLLWRYLPKSGLGLEQ